MKPKDKAKEKSIVDKILSEQWHEDFDAIEQEWLEKPEDHFLGGK